MTDGVVLNPGTGGATVDTETNASRSNAQMQRMKLVLGDVDVDGGDVSLTNPAPVMLSRVNYVISTLNSTTTQLAAGQTWTGEIEAGDSQPAISIDVVSDQSGTLTLSQFIDAAGTQPLRPVVFPITAGVGFGWSLTLNGNYVRLSFLNGGIGPTTTLSISTAYGVINSATSLGNAPVAMMEVGGQTIDPNIGFPVDVQAVNGAPVATKGIPVVDPVIAFASENERPLSQVIVGSGDGDYAGQSLIELLMNPDSKESAAVRVVNPPKLDASGATVVSDALSPGTYTFGGANQQIIVDTTGYASVALAIVGTWAGTITFTQSNDLQTWQTLQGVVSSAPQVALGATSVNGQFLFPAMARYVRAQITTYTSGLAVLVPYLRIAPFTALQAANLNFINGTAPVTANVAGMLAVGGNIAHGSAPTAFPLLAGGTDYNGLTRRVQTDNSGNQIAAGSLPAGYAVGQYNVTYSKTTVAFASAQFPTLTAAQSSVAPVLIGGVDPGGFVRQAQTTPSGQLSVSLDAPSASGQSVAELLAQLVALMRVNNYYQAVGLGPTADDPEAVLGEYLAQNPIN